LFEKKASPQGTIYFESSPGTFTISLITNSCLKANGKCYPNPCNTYHDCNAIAGTCQPNYYCCSGTCSYTEDLNNDGIVNIFDLVIVAKRYGAKPTNPNWNSKFDLEKDNRIDEKDLLRVVERLKWVRKMRRKRHG